MNKLDTIGLMSKNNQLKFFLAAAIILSFFSGFIYLRLSKLNSFLEGISYVHNVYLPNNQIKKVIYLRGKNFAGENILLTDRSFNPDSAITIATGLTPGDLRQQTVNFYNKAYFVLGYSTGEGCGDYLIFDEDGKVITKALFQQVDKSKLSINYICDGSIQDLREDGKLTLKVSQSNPPQQEATIEIDITTGKLKNVLPKPKY